MSNNGGAPGVSVWGFEDGTHWTVQIDTAQRTGALAVDVNDGRVFFGDPEQFDPVAAAQAVLGASGQDHRLHPDIVRALVDAVRGDAT